MGGDWRSSEVHPFSGSNFLHLYLLPDFEHLQLGLSQSFLGLDQSLGGGQRVGGSGLVDGDTGNFTNRKPRPLEAINLRSGKINLNMRYIRNATKLYDTTYLDDPSLNDGVIEPDESDFSVLSPGHGDETKPLASLVVVDDFSFLHVSKLSKEHDEVVLPGIICRVITRNGINGKLYLKRKGMLETWSLLGRLESPPEDLLIG